MNAESYRFDKWMVKFLIAHALALEDKADDGWHDSISNITEQNAYLERGLVAQAMIQDIQRFEIESHVPR